MTIFAIPWPNVKRNWDRIRLGMLASIDREQKNYEQALTLMQQVSEILRDGYGPDDPSVAAAMAAEAEIRCLLGSE